MRTARDRIRHTILFEIFGLLLVTPLGALAFAMPLQDIGVIGIGGATLAMLWNYIYNYGFDRLMQRWRGTTLKTLPLRVLHAILFELGLLLALLPLIAWYLGITLWQALVMDIAFALFYMVYAFVFNLAYDRVYPIPAPDPA
ncbi:PACE efflux transporter [Devosia alba]|uniref:PACE efflux transporter n=1 Tax=Devosia alba TaxID=3152360 RepID=UPI0032652AD6